MSDYSAVLSMYTIYHNVSDYPSGYVVRRFEIGQGVATPTTDATWAPTLDEVRTAIPWGFVCLNRDPNDEPAIVEVWL